MLLHDLTTCAQDLSVKPHGCIASFHASGFRIHGNLRTTALQSARLIAKSTVHTLQSPTCLTIASFMEILNHF